MITGKNFIGNTLTSLGDVSFKTFNPAANTENPTDFTEASRVEIDKAVALANEAFKEFSDISNDRKGEFINAIADEIEALGTELIETYCMESGLPEGRAIGERGRTLFQLRMFADLRVYATLIEQLTIGFRRHGSVPGPLSRGVSTENRG